jgi:hypothetical protein
MMSHHMKLTPGFLLLLSLAACSTTGQWSRDGTAPKVAAEDLADCNSLAQQVVQRDTNIDADIDASRGQDWRSAQVVDVKRAAFQSKDEGTEKDVVDRCMVGKGYAPAS